MKYPSKSDIVTAVKYPDKFIKDTFLKGGTIKRNVNGQPFMFSGGFSLVFQILKNNQKYAFRVWFASIDDVKERFQIISKFLSQTSIKYFSEFNYFEGGLLVSGILLDTTRMLWVEGDLLKDYLYKHLNNRRKLEKLSESFLTMFKELHANLVSHGDLQHGNIIINKNDEIKLIDYDSLYVPDLQGYKEIVTGLKGYQHPARFKNKYASEKADYFSELIIYLSILALSEEPLLWEKYKIKDSEELLFTNDDFLDFNNSIIKSDLLKLSPKIGALVKVLEEYLSKNTINELVPFYEVLEALFKDPDIIKFTANKTFIENAPDRTIIISWRVKFANDISITNIGKHLENEGKKDVLITKDTTFIIEAKNALNKTTMKLLKIEVSKDAPIIEEFSLSKQVLTDTTPSILTWNVSGSEIINISYVGDNLPVFGKKELFFKEDRIIKIEAISYFGYSISKQIELKVSKVPPVIKLFSANFLYIIPNTDVEFKWDVKNASLIKIRDTDNNVVLASKKSIGKFSHKVLKPGKFTLEASTIFDIHVKRTLIINALPIPIIESLEVSEPSIDMITNIDLSAIEVPKSLIMTRNIHLDIPLDVKQSNIIFNDTHIFVNSKVLNNFNQGIIKIKNPEFVLNHNLKIDTLVPFQKLLNNIQKMLNKMFLTQKNTRKDEKSITNN